MDSVVKVWRGDLVESLHRVSVAVVDVEGNLVAGCGDPALTTFLRSSAKPFQAVPFIESGAAKAFSASDEELAILTGSHGGEPKQVGTVSSLLSRAGLSEKDLKCGRHRPYTDSVARILRENYSAVHHNCSGKHAGMLATAKHLGEALGSYQDPSHPVQARCRNVVGELCGDSNAPLHEAVDGCGVVTFGTSLVAMARGFATLANPVGRHKIALERVRDAMIAHPDMVAGESHFNTKLMRSAPRLVAKAGAEGLFCAGVIGRGIGIALKVEDGEKRAVAPAMLATMRALGFDAPGLDPVAAPVVKNFAGWVVGRIEASITLVPPPTKEK
ncbi:MAG: asparaginase [Euryarchaeota archaeon]|nr:asparaginase [Euryarchaeota archaeon]